MVVSDRASALLKVCKSDYLSTYSMPDLFHFMQDLGKAVGGQLGLQYQRAAQLLSLKDTGTEDYKLLEKDLLEKQSRLSNYKTHRQQINKLIHPFNEQDCFTDPKTLGTQLNINFTKIRSIAKQANIAISLSRATKILNQIPQIAGGIAHWLKWLQTKIAELDLADQELEWLKECLLPYAYWQVYWAKTTRKKKDKKINLYYKERLKKAQNRFENHPLSNKMKADRKEQLVNWAFTKVATFQRASSRVEGRNGYLAFVNHAHKGIPEKRKKALTVIHNFDIRGSDGKTPAQRLFNTEFPNLFDYIVDNMIKLPRPRKRKTKNKLSA